MKKILLILMQILPSALLAQQAHLNGKISGQIYSELKVPVEYGTARLLLAKDFSFVQGTTTDKHGSFEFSSLEYNAYLLEISAIGYQRFLSGPISISPTEPVAVLKELMLKRKNTILGEVTITGTVPVIETELGKIILNVDKSTLAAGASVIDLLAFAPGVIVDKDDRLSLKGKQGVDVLIDNRPPHLSPEDLAVMLRNMDTGNIAKIEIMSTPSARYDSRGSAGIINIKTKKNKLPGFNGTFNGTLGYASAAQLMSSPTISYKHNKFNILASYNYSHSNRINETSIRRAVTGSGASVLFDEAGDMEQTFNNHALKGAMEYSFNRRNTLSVIASGFSNQGAGSGSNITSMMNPALHVDSFLIASNIADKRFTNQSYNLNYRTLLDTSGMELAFDIDYSGFEKTTTDQLRNSYYFGSGQILKPERIYRGLAPSLINIKAAKIDFILPTRNGRLETGLKSSLVSTDNDYRFEQLLNNSWISDVEKTNYFKFDEAINSGYLSFSHDIRKLSLQAGIRAEHTHSTGNSITTGLVVDSSYFKVFPTIFLSYKLPGKSSMSASLSQRLDRPGYEDLNPFLFLQDEYTYNEGNPYLRPQYSNNVEIAYNSGNNLNLSAGYSRTQDIMITVTEQNDETKVTRAIRRNLEKETSYYLGATTTLPVSQQWAASANISLFHLGYRDPDLNAGRMALYLNVNNQVKLKYGLRLELQGRYQSPMSYGIFTISDQYQVDGGLQKQILKNRGSLKFSVTDILNSKRSLLNTSFKNMNLKVDERSNSRSGRLSFSYRFGKAAGKAGGNRKTVSDDEAKRVKGL